KALERERQEVLSEAWPLVDDVQLSGAVLRDRGDRDVPASVAEGVVDEIRERLLEVQPVGRQHDRLAGVDGDLPLGAEAARDVLEEIHHIHLLRLQAQLALLGAREKEEVVRDPREPIRLLRGRGDGGLQLPFGSTWL